MNRFKEKWGIESNIQFWIIMIVFAVTGSSAAFVSKPILGAFGLIRGESEWYLYWPMYVLIMFPTYQILLLCYGFIFGQWKFFWGFEQKMLSRMGLMKKSESADG